MSLESTQGENRYQNLINCIHNKKTSTSCIEQHMRVGKKGGKIIQLFKAQTLTIRLLQTGKLVIDTGSLKYLVIINIG